MAMTRALDIAVAVFLAWMAWSFWNLFSLDHEIRTMPPLPFAVDVDG